MIAVIAGTHEEFKRFLFEKVRNEGMKLEEAKRKYKEAYELDMIRGLLFESYIEIGTWYNRNDTFEITEYLKTHIRP